MVAYSGLMGQADSALGGSVGNIRLSKDRTLWQMACYLAWEVKVKDPSI